MYKKKSPQVLSTADLSMAYEKPIFENLNVSIEPGSMTAIVGANGSGKSTLLKALARLQKPSAGAVLIGDKNIATVSPREFAKQVGLLSQHPIAPEGITVRELVMRGRYPHQKLVGRTPKSEIEIVDEVIARAGLADLAGRKLSDLSGGQRQRAWIAMALAQESDILLLDEPTTFLDLSHQLEVLDLLSSLNQERGMTVVMVIHDLNMAARFCDRFIMVADGKIMAQGSPEEVLNPKNLAAAFKILARVIQDPVSKRPMIVPVRHLSK